MCGSVHAVLVVVIETARFTAQSKVSYLDDTVVVQETVGRLQIPVDQSLMVDVLNASGNLMEQIECVWDVDSLFAIAFSSILVHEEISERVLAAKLHLDIQGVS